jgi:hypothetical protein
MPSLRIEHVALNVSDPVALAAWYTANPGNASRAQGDAPQHVHFLADTRPARPSSTSTTTPRTGHSKSETSGNPSKKWDGLAPPRSPARGR